MRVYAPFAVTLHVIAVFCNFFALQLCLYPKQQSVTGKIVCINKMITCVSHVKLHEVILDHAVTGIVYTPKRV